MSKAKVAGPVAIIENGLKRPLLTPRVVEAQKGRSSVPLGVWTSWGVGGGYVFFPGFFLRDSLLL